MVGVPGPLLPFLPFLYAAIILLLSAGIAQVVRALIARAMRGSVPQAAVAASRIAYATVWVAGIILAVQEVGISTTILLLLVALVGVAAIVAVREPLENIAARYFADIYVPFRLGDAVEVGPHAGTVIEINAISTILLSKEDQLVSIPNTRFVREVVVNTSPQAWKEIALPVSIGSSVDLPTFESELLKSLSKLRPRLDRRFPPMLAVRNRSPQSTDLTLTVMLRSPEERATIVSEVNRRVAEVLQGLTAPPR